VWPSAFQRGEVERLLPVASALGECPKCAQGPRQPRLGPDPQVYTGRARLSVRRLHAPPLQLGRPAEVTDGRVYLPQAKGRSYLQGTLAKRGREFEGLLARRNGAIVVSRLPEYNSHLGQHLSQPSPIVERPGQGLGFAQQCEAPLVLSQCGQRAIHSEAEVDSQYPGVAVLGQVRKGLKGLLEGSHRLAERGAVAGPGAGLLAVGHGFVPHLAPQGMVRQAFDLLGPPLGRQRLKGLDNAPVQYPPPLQQETVVGDLVCQGMLESVFWLREQAGLIQELRRLQVRQAATGSTSPFTGTGPRAVTCTRPSTRCRVAAVRRLLPGVAYCSMRAARCVVSPTAE
jgi:hypothetical protein